jgi:amidase
MMTNAVRTAIAGLLVLVVAGCTDSVTPADRSAGPSPTPSESSATPSQTPSDTAPPTPLTGPVPFPMDATIPELQRAMRTGRITALELVDFYLARIAAYDDSGPAVNALITVNPDARDQAAALDAERAESGPRGPLHGIPVVVKDNIDTSEMLTTGGTLPLEDFQPVRDAFQVRKLRDAGAIIIAKANLAELAQSAQTYSPVGGQTLNPYDTSREPGGSSGGTAVAVTANFAVAGLGTDTCGSIRLPAGLNNLYGLRPTHGLSSRAGVIPLSSSLDEVGPMARTVRDLAVMLDATAGQDPDDPATVPLSTSFVDAVDAEGLEGRRIGVVRFAWGKRMGGALQKALDEMGDNGAELIDGVKVPLLTVTLEPFFDEFPSALAHYFAGEPTAPGGAWDALIGHESPASTAEVPATKEYRKAIQYRVAYRRSIESLMDALDLDAIAYPVSTTVAQPIGGPSEPNTSHAYCGEPAIAGLPALTVPAGFSHGLPVSLELMGRTFDEGTLLSIAAGYEAHTDHRGLPPTTPPLPD